MSSKKHFLALTVVLVSALALAPQSEAATPELDPVIGEFPISATATSGTVTFATATRSITCTSGSGSGSATSKTTGEGGLSTLFGCKESLFGLSCTSSGQSTGTVKLEPTTMHLVYLDENHTKPGVLTTPPASGVFAKYSCAGITVEVKGNGILGELTSPKCGGTSKAATVVTEMSAPGTQKYRQIEETGTAYDMTAKFGSGSFETAAITASVTGTSEREGTLTCPEQK